MFKNILRCSALAVLGIILFTGVSYAGDVQVTISGNGLGGSEVTVNSITFSSDGTPLSPTFPIGVTVTDDEVKVVGLKNVPDFNDFCIDYTVTAKSGESTFCVETADYTNYSVYTFSDPATIQVSLAPTIPSLTPYGLMVLALLVAGTAVWVLRRRNAFQAI